MDSRIYFYLIILKWLSAIKVREEENQSRLPAYAKAEIPPAPLPDLNSNGILYGYWHDWGPQVDLASIPAAYNIISVAFMEQEEGSLPSFTLNNISEQDLIAGIRVLKDQGRPVLLSLGGADGNIALSESDKTPFKNELLRIIDQYGFSGIDINLEGDSVTAADNQTVIPAVLREIKEYYRSRGVHFLITMAPEFEALRGAAAGYRPYIEDLEGFYDLVAPQYYNQGADGIWSDEYGMYLSQDDNQYKAQFLYTLTHAIVTGSEDYVKIPADKFAIGLPASPSAALNGYVENSEDVQWALDRLASEGNAIRGLMTWSINHDAANGYEFEEQYAPMV